ncbi:PecA family PE domain-processing aspartic protease [Mycobacterium sp. CVI_P3]|uniref:PecA family PE domain-processing aspartic protease n=1 Tax=Mycobacterium pinniadriaticum TaxID=2994102 RepID=A0ABT3SG40_9MYCO|nr:PecA family PE domain-processing aspartic protease [Mycobacterium pinniadriaticum]MCX2932054.1 PecA family PE domain-processing aspartic protease [Mycobacterium pinniadriaticum]MCX2938478.1 PecA family PE domain-processing aspartic protease [Mycobacterium pinniadriaticum]
MTTSDADTAATTSDADTAATTSGDAVPAADSTPSSTSWLPSDPIVAGVAVNLAQQQIAQAQSLLQQQTWGSGNVAAGVVAIAPQILLAQAAWALDTWETATPGAQSLYASTSGIPIVHELAGVGLLGALLLPTMATTSLSGAGLFLPLVGALEGTGGITGVQNLVSTAAQNGRVYALVPVTMRSITEPIVYISINGGQSTPVLVDTGSSGLVVTMASVGDAEPLGDPTGTGTSGYSGGLTYSYTTYTTTVDFGHGIVTEPTSVNIVDAADAADALAFFHQLGGASGVLGIGANAYGPGPSIPTAALPGELSDGVFLYQGLILGVAGVMVFGPNPLPTRVSVAGAPISYLNVKINNGSQQTVGAIIDSGGVYGTMLTSVASSLPVGTRISVYTQDGVLLYSYLVTSQNRPTLITSGLINTGYVPFQHGPVYINYTAPGGLGSTDFDYA